MINVKNLISRVLYNNIDNNYTRFISNKIDTGVTKIGIFMFYLYQNCSTREIRAQLFDWLPYKR